MSLVPYTSSFHSYSLKGSQTASTWPGFAFRSAWRGLCERGIEPVPNRLSSRTSDCIISRLVRQSRSLCTSLNYREIITNLILNSASLLSKCTLYVRHCKTSCSELPYKIPLPHSTNHNAVLIMHIPFRDQVPHLKGALSFTTLLRTANHIHYIHNT
jgi:hypothetical protein